MQFPLAVALFNLDVNATFKDNNINSQKTAAMYLLRGLDLKTASGYTSRFPRCSKFRISENGMKQTNTIRKPKSTFSSTSKIHKMLHDFVLSVSPPINGPHKIRRGYLDACESPTEDLHVFNCQLAQVKFDQFVGVHILGDIFVT